MVKPKVTGKAAASAASANLKSGSTGGKTKTASGSALSQTKDPKKFSSTDAASAASAVLSDERTSKRSKSAAGSTLAQKASKTKGS
jgi:hypothetical protein